MASSKVLDLSRCNTIFGLDLFKKLAVEKEEENIFFSPFGIYSTMAMTSIGARNETLQQLRKALRIDAIPEQEVHKIYLEWHDSILLEARNCCTMRLANRLYGEKSYKLKSDFLHACMEYYWAGLADVDFRNDTAGAVKAINEWVNSFTNGKIKDIVNENMVNSLTTLILVTGMCFKGDWKSKFDPKLTKEDDFHITDSRKIKVRMMFMSKAILLYGEDDNLGCQILELPYVGNYVSMVIFLPDLSKTTLKEMVGKLTQEIIQNLRVTSREVSAWLPRFKLENDFNLKKTLEALGIKDLFEPNRADLSGIAEGKELYVNSAIHKALIEVDEEGSEAVAATAVEMRNASPMNTPAEFRADHPFVFFIRNNQSKTILFHGRLIKPCLTT